MTKIFVVGGMLIAWISFTYFLDWFYRRKVLEWVILEWEKRSN